MRVAAIACPLLLLATVAIPGLAQTQADDEQAIRQIVAKLNAGERVPGLALPDTVFWSGAMVKPAVGNEKPQIRPGSSAPTGRSNSMNNERIVQLLVASSGDMASEYGTFKTSWVRDIDKQKIEFEGALLRTWRKVDGRWRIAAEFRRPYDDSPTTR